MFGNIFDRLLDLAISFLSVPNAFTYLSPEREETLLTRGMIIALIAWNIAITVVLLIAIIAIICVCVDMDNSKRYDYRPSTALVGGRDSEDTGSSSFAGHTPQMRELRDDVSEYYKVGSIGNDHTLESVRF